MADVNERFLTLSNRYSSAERELHELRFALKKMKALNDGVDHLWMVKETEYENVNELLREMSTQ